MSTTAILSAFSVPGGLRPPKDKPMKKPKPAKANPEMCAEYDFRGGERGRYARRFGQRVGVLLDPDVAEVFTDSASVNDVLRAVARLVHEDRRQRRKKTPARR